MPILDAEVVVGAVDVGGNYCGKVTAVLLAVGATGHIQHALGVGVALAGVMGRAHVQLQAVSVQSRQSV